MIVSFADKQTERIFNREMPKRFPPTIITRSRKKLLALDAAEQLDDLRVPPSNRLEALKGDRQGQQSIRINQQWRLCFRWSDNNAHDVEIVDYH
jgi:proteic killer suppression protein